MGGDDCDGEEWVGGWVARRDDSEGEKWVGGWRAEMSGWAGDGRR